ncbi:hypothetical [Yersinia pestis KIM10+]|uniref:Uncharacterized protein n=1 Tax=Yersinia pestis TaxID=632 RepID=Q8CL17_YERPE|nr:hypothetical [Yersinia pestis KIM10+]
MICLVKLPGNGLIILVYPVCKKYPASISKTGSMFFLQGIKNELLPIRTSS